MASFSIFDISGSAMSAQSVRLNTVASNMANVDVVSPTPEGAYRAKQPVFQAVLDSMGQNTAKVPVRVTEIRESKAEPMQEYAPSHPQANAEGYIYRSNVNVVEQMADMMSASRNYQTNVDVLNTVKRLMLSTLRLGQQ
ncbi:MAG: flagellar basal body rod protein FlgC [Gammaproteobacteria bacterium]|nr:flagellar basal body rod protein FlgC [Gammaproteobacteria bacterium]MDX5375432.1 flagellar basal body rod protein FlgC [Gammaproteobacteria bacterium]